MKIISETYFYAPQDQFRGNKFYLIGPEVIHAHSALRCTVGDIITIVDGCGYEYEVSIEQMHKERIEGTILERRKSPREPVSEITLAQALCRATKFDSIVEKTTELGIRSIVPTITGRSRRLPGKEQLERKIQRWQKIAIAAMKQSRRSVLPQIATPSSFDEVLILLEEYDLSLIAWEEEKMQGLRTIMKKVDSVKSALILVGPEGGFRQEEVERAQEAGCYPVSFGRRRLRVETAGPLAVSLLLYELGELA